jgi:hypothetical protein
MSVIQPTPVSANFVMSLRIFSVSGRGYRDPGSLAIIGRSAAAVDFGFVRITGFVGWLVWGFAHIFFLIGSRSRIAVFLEWAWEWLTYARGARLIIGPAGARRGGEARRSPSSPFQRRSCRASSCNGLLAGASVNAHGPHDLGRRRSESRNKISITP